MKEAVQYFIGEHDFKSFKASLSALAKDTTKEDELFNYIGYEKNKNKKRDNHELSL